MMGWAGDDKAEGTDALKKKKKVDENKGKPGPCKCNKRWQKGYKVVCMVIHLSQVVTYSFCHLFMIYNISIYL